MRHKSKTRRLHLILVICITALLFISSNFAAEWQKKYTYEQVRENFQQPPLFYAPHTFWFWDAPLDKYLTASMAREMTKQRLNPGYAHARHSGAADASYPSLPLEQWLSPLWFKSFGSALSEAQKAGMTLGYCDEYWWPSGQAGGRVLEKNPELAAQSLEWKKQSVSGPGEVDLPVSKFTVAGRLSGTGKIIAETLRIIGENKAFRWEIPAGEWVVYSYTTYHHAGVDGGEVNYLDDRLMATFIPIAHDAYEKHFKAQMGSAIPGVFVDNEGDFGWQMAWSDYLAKHYMEMKNRDIRLRLPLLTEEDEDGFWAKARYDWFDVVSEVYSTQYLGRLSDWLGSHNMYCISNLWEEDLMLQTRAVGDFMRAQRAVSMPGNDCLQMKSQQVHDFKETQSVCEFEDRPFMSELMGVAGWEQTPVQMKMTLNSVTAWGITHTVPHGINLNRKLETIPYPADWYTENPYWRYLHLWTDFARRASFVNRQGKLVADVLLINPLESIWALSEGYFTSADGNRWPDKVREINDIYAAAMDTLTARRLDYLIADRHYMERSTLSKSSEKGMTSLIIGDHRFRVVILPPVFILSQSTASKLLAYAKAGGAIIILGDLPQGSPERGAEDQKIIKEMRELIKLPSVVNLADLQNKRSLLADKIETIIEKQVEIISGDLPLLVSHRQIGQRDFYWLANNTGREGIMSLSFREASGGVEIWNCENGEINPIASESDHDRKSVTLGFDPYQAFWLVFDPEKSEIKYKSESTPKFKELDLTGSWQFSFPQTDSVIVTSARSFITADKGDHPEYLPADFDDSDWEWIYITGPVRFYDSWRATVLYNPDAESDRYYRYKFRLNQDPDEALINISADNQARFWVNGQPIKPGPNASFMIKPDLHDIKLFLNQGENVLAVKASNHPGYGWMVLQGTVNLNDGKVHDILSGPAWKESKNEITGWQEVNFNDSDWDQALVASKAIEEQELRTMYKPVKTVLNHGAAWWRFDIPPASSEVRLSGLSEKRSLWIDGKPVIPQSGRILLPAGAKIMVVRVNDNDSRLTGPVIFRCKGQGQVRPGSWLNLGLKNFTGFADYEINFNLPENVSSLNLDLGKVLHMAEVWVNDIKVGERLWPPFVFGLDEGLREGENKLRIRIGNLMVNKMSVFDALGTLRHWGWVGAPEDSDFDAGLFGPVRLKFID